MVLPLHLYVQIPPQVVPRRQVQACVLRPQCLGLTFRIRKGNRLQQRIAQGAEQSVQHIVKQPVPCRRAQQKTEVQVGGAVDDIRQLPLLLEAQHLLPLLLRHGRDWPLLILSHCPHLSPGLPSMAQLLPCSIPDYSKARPCGLAIRKQDHRRCRWSCHAARYAVNPCGSGPSGPGPRCGEARAASPPSHPPPRACPWQISPPSSWARRASGTTLPEPGRPTGPPRSCPRSACGSG